MAGGFTLNATGSNDVPQFKAMPMNHVTIRNNVLIGVDNANVGWNGRLFHINNPIENLTIEHNAGFSPSNASFIWGRHAAASESHRSQTTMIPCNLKAAPGKVVVP